MNGESAIVLDVRKRVGSNVIEVVEAARAVIDSDAPNLSSKRYCFLTSKDTGPSRTVVAASSFEPNQSGNWRPVIDTINAFFKLLIIYLPFLY